MFSYNRRMLRDLDKLAAERPDERQHVGGNGIGKDRIKIWAQKLKENTAEYARMSREVDADYANEKLRQRVSQVYGEEVSCLYEDELRGGK